MGNYFASVFTVEGNNDNCNKLPPKLIKYQCPNVVYSKEKVLEKLKDLNTSKSSGPDSIHPRILWEISNEIVQPLQIMFETSFRLGTLPRTGDQPILQPFTKRVIKLSLQIIVQLI